MLRVAEECGQVVQDVVVVFKQLLEVSAELLHCGLLVDVGERIIRELLVNFWGNSAFYEFVKVFNQRLLAFRLFGDNERDCRLTRWR